MSEILQTDPGGAHVKLPAGLQPDTVYHVQFTHHHTAFKRLWPARTFREWVGNHIPFRVLPLWANDLLRRWCWGHV